MEIMLRGRFFEFIIRNWLSYVLNFDFVVVSRETTLIHNEFWLHSVLMYWIIMVYLAFHAHLYNILLLFFFYFLLWEFKILFGCQASERKENIVDWVFFFFLIRLIFF